MVERPVALPGLPPHLWMALFHLVGAVAGGLVAFLLRPAAPVWAGLIGALIGAVVLGIAGKLFLAWRSHRGSKNRL